MSISYNTNNTILQSRLRNGKQYAIAVWVIMGLLVVVILFLLQLIILHLYLIVVGKTTYQFLIQRRNQEIFNKANNGNGNGDGDGDDGIVKRK